MIDGNLQTLFYAEFDKQNGASAANRNGPMPMEQNERIKDVCTLERLIRKPYRTALDYYGRAYCYNLYISDQFCGCVSVNELGMPFQAWEFPVMAHFFSYFRNAFFKYLRAGSRQESDSLLVLRKALSRQPLSDEEQEQLRLSPDESWLCFELRERPGEHALPMDYMYATLNAALPLKICAVIYHEKIAGLLRVSAKTPYDPANLSSFTETVARMGYHAGLSNAFPSLLSARDYLQQAKYALEHASGEASVLRFFRDCALDYMLESCVGEHAVDDLLSCGLKLLIEHDRQKGSEYLHTLDVYLQNEMNVSRTAEALYIHRSSLLKRLDKIDRMLEGAPDTPEKRLYLRLCMELLRKSGKVKL